MKQYKFTFLFLAVFCGYAAAQTLDTTTLLAISPSIQISTPSSVSKTVVAVPSVSVGQPLVPGTTFQNALDTVGLKITTDTVVVDISRVPVEARPKVSEYLQIWFDYLQDKLSERKRDKKIKALNLTVDDRFFALDAMDGTLTETEFFSASGEGLPIYSMVKIWTSNFIMDRYTQQCYAEGYETCVMKYMLPSVNKNINIKSKMDLLRAISADIQANRYNNHKEFTSENLLAIVTEMVPIFSNKQNPNYLRQHALEIYISFEKRRDEFYKNYELLKLEPDFFAISDIGYATNSYPELAGELLGFLEKPYDYPPGLVRAAYRYLSADIFDFPNDPDGSRRRREKKILHQLEQDKDIKKILPSANFENSVRVLGFREHDLGLKP